MRQSVRTAAAIQEAGGPERRDRGHGCGSELARTVPCPEPGLEDKPVRKAWASRGGLECGLWAKHGGAGRRRKSGLAQAVLLDPLRA